MEFKKVILSLVFLSFLLVGCTSQYSNQTGSSNPTGTTGASSSASSNGRMVMIIKDAAADMGSVSSIKITVDKVMVQSATKGWVTVSSTPKTYDLLELKAKGSAALLADLALEQGTYNQIRMDVSNVIVTDANGSQQAKLPSGMLKFVGPVEVGVNSTTTASFDFIADESLHITGNGKYILAPVVKFETRENATVNVKSNSDVEINGGNAKVNVKIGMNEKGDFAQGLRIANNVELGIDASGLVRIGPASDNANSSANVGIGIGIGR
ncbi:MAG: DUF4382 domain-containing protein [Candidatus Micrarchaeota archaeon]